MAIFTDGTIGPLPDPEGGNPQHNRGETIASGQENGNNQYVIDWINGGHITDENIAAGGLTGLSLGTASIGNDQIGDPTLDPGVSGIDGSKLWDLSVGTLQLSDLSVTNGKLAIDAVQDNVIVNNTISGAKVADSSIGISKLNFTIPTGTVGQMFPGAVGWHTGMSAPPQWFVADGQELDATTYSILSSVYGATGAGDGLYDNHPAHGLPAPGNFRVPDILSRTVIGPDTGSLGPAGRVTSDNALTDVSGSESHVLTEAELAQHDHVVTDTGHAHGVTDSGHGHGTSGTHQHDSLSGDPLVRANITRQDIGGVSIIFGGAAGSATVLALEADASPVGADFNPNTSSNSAGITIGQSPTGVVVDPAFTGVSVNDAGNGDAHNNMQPYIVLLPVIYSGL